jgi:ribosomal protein S27E
VIFSSGPRRPDTLDRATTKSNFVVTCKNCTKLNILFVERQPIADFSVKCEHCGRRFFASPSEVQKG